MRVLDRFKEEAEFYLEGSNLNLLNTINLVFLNTAFQLNLFYRLTNKLHKKIGNRRIVWIIPRFLTYLEKILYGSFISPQAKIGKRFQIIYGMGIIIGAEVKIGDNVTIFNGVTFGSTIPGKKDVQQPQVGNNVLIGSGAKLLGKITIGDNVRIGANAVVLKSFESDVTIAGMPAKIVKKNA